MPYGGAPLQGLPQICKFVFSLYNCELVVESCIHAMVSLLTAVFEPFNMSMLTNFDVELQE